MMQQIKKVNKKELREFGLLFGAIMAGLFGLFLPWLLDHNLPLWPWYILVVMASVAIVLPIALTPVYFVWMRFGLVMGWINTRIILGIVFYFMFTPIALVLKLLGKDLLQRKLDSNLKTYRVESKNNPPEHMEKPY